MRTRLQTEIGQRAPFTSAEHEVYLNVLRTAAVLEHRVAERLKAYGLTPTQYNVLRILRGAGEGGLCRNDVRARMLTPVPDSTRLLDRLADAGLVARNRESGDRRFVTTRVTKRGLTLLAELDEPIAAMHVEQLGHMRRSELRHLADLLEKAREAE